MSRIEATVATQVGDASRPRQAVRDSQLQVEQARSLALQAQDPSNESIKSDDLRAVAQQLKQVVEAASGRSLDFNVDEESKLSYVTVRDMTSGEVIRQIPSEEVRDLKKRIDAMIGLLFDKQA
jgi:flagellar protein FlaG